MVKIEILMDEGKVCRILELEKERYINFFTSSYEDNLKHAVFVKNDFPRWSIISGYYAMHDISKLFLAKSFGLKVEFEVHSTTIKLLRELLKNKEILKLIDKGYQAFTTLANDLAEAKRERVKTQYYTGSEFMKSEYRKKATVFLDEIVNPFIEKMKQILDEE